MNIIKNLILLTIFLYSTTVFAEELPFANSYYCDIDGIKLHYRVWKQKKDVNNKRYILFVHGFAGSTFSWRKNVEQIANNGYEVVCVDLPAYGYSTRKLGLNHSNKSRAELLWNFIDFYEKDKVEQNIKWILVGHSMGGRVVSEMAIQKLQKTEILVLVDAAIYERPATTDSFTKIPAMKNIMRDYIEKSFINYKAVKEFLNSAYGEPASDEDIKGFLRPLEIKGTADAILDTFTSSGTISRPNISEIISTTLIIWGEKDA